MFLERTKVTNISRSSRQLNKNDEEEKEEQ
jgi:hypothetical protein